jgi:hypothetical protein
MGQVGTRVGSVLSDSRPVDQTSRIYKCETCGHWQKAHTSEDWKVIGATYSDYRGHQLSGGVEQLVFPPGLPPRPRSYHALEQCVSNLPAQGRLLDFGCGDGAVLKSASQLLKGWELDAYDISDHYEKTLLAIPGVKRFFSKKTEPLPEGVYDLVVLWHTLEHVPFPTEELKGLRKYVNESGKLLIQIPDVARNPFDLGVFDHVSHFTRDQLVECAKLAGWKLLTDGWDWTHNCLTVLLGVDTQDSKPSFPVQSENLLSNLNARIEKFCTGVEGEPFVVWGTGMASLLLLTHLPHPPLCFVDEDEAREGGEVRGIPIHFPNSVEPVLKTILPFPPQTAARIQERAVRDYAPFKHSQWIA